MEPNSDLGISESDVSAIFERHAFDPWLPGNRQRNCLYVMDRMAFDAAVREAIATSEAARLKAEAACVAYRNELRSEIISEWFACRATFTSKEAMYAKADARLDAIADAGQPILDALEAARRMSQACGALDTVMFTRLKRDFDAADAKLKGVS